MKLIKSETYLALIKNSVGSHLFRSVYFESDSITKDMLEDGNLSCAFYVSTILYILKMIDLHLTVDGIVKDIKMSGKFSQVDGEFEPGDVLVWDETIESNGHRHVGFYIGENKAVSSSPSERKIIVHHYTYDSKRKIIEVFRPKF